MIAVSLTVPALATRCSVSGRAICRSIVHVVSGAGPLVRAPLATGRAAPGPLYEPMTSKLCAVVRPSEAPVSRARVVGWPRSKGRSHEESAASVIAPATVATKLLRRVQNELEFTKAIGPGTGCLP